MLRVNPKYEIRSTPRDTLWWKQYQMTEIQITKAFFVYNAEPFAFTVGFENLSI